MNCEEVLKQHQLRITKQRIEVLRYYMNSTRAISHNELESHFDGTIDRVSIYRILHAFTKANILCKIVDSIGKTSYVTENIKHSNSHFKCNSCNSVIELPELPESYLTKLPELNIQHLQLLAEGTCKNCSDIPNNEIRTKNS
jgi:Fur family transcriptional regulator, ferric uptake regulator